MTTVHLIIIINNPQPWTARRTPSAPPTAPASSSAAVPSTITDTSVFERSVLLHHWVWHVNLLIIFYIFVFVFIVNRGSSRFSRCLCLLERLRLWWLSCCGSPRDVRPSHSEAAELRSTSLSAMIYWAETEREKADTKSELTPRLLLNMVFYFTLFYLGTYLSGF